MSWRRWLAHGYRFVIGTGLAIFFVAILFGGQIERYLWETSNYTDLNGRYMAITLLIDGTILTIGGVSWYAAREWYLRSRNRKAAGVQT